jgi:hypothetical protein
MYLPFQIFLKLWPKQNAISMAYYNITLLKSNTEAFY